MPCDKRARIVDNAVAALAEHFDTVQVFVSRWDGAPRGTYAYSKGTGNVFARQGQVVDWADKPIAHAGGDDPGDDPAGDDPSGDAGEFQP